jgi:hypothetical protein
MSELNKLSEKWRKRVGEHPKPSDDVWVGFDNGLMACADELEAAIAAEFTKVRKGALEYAGQMAEDYYQMPTKEFKAKYGITSLRDAKPAIRALAQPGPKERGK